MVRHLKRFALAASYVTSFYWLPNPQNEDELAQLAKYLPTVGIVIGICLALVFAACRSSGIDALVTSIIVIMAWLLITGCIHLDGFMDSADGLMSHRSRERMLEIMKDSRVGNFGAISGVMLLLTKFAALTSLPSPWVLPALLLVPVWARWVEVFAIACYPYARQEGMGKIWHDTTKKSDLMLAAAIPGLFTLLICWFWHSETYSLLLPLTLLPGLAFSFAIFKALQGQTGDTYGACVEFSEAAALLLLSITCKFI